MEENMKVGMEKPSIEVELAWKRYEREKYYTEKVVEEERMKKADMESYKNGNKTN